MSMQRVTDHPIANEQLLYFTSPSLTADDEHLVFLSDRTGEPNVYVRHMSTGRERQLTDNRDGVLRSYVYFDGEPHTGLGKASVCLDPARRRLYYLQGNDVCVADFESRRRRLATLPGDQVTAFTHVSRDGRRLCVPTTDADAFEADPSEPGRGIDRRVRERDLCSHLCVYDTENAELLFREPVKRAWITHVQFHPADPNVILYNHEWPSECGRRRMWMWDGREHRALRTMTDGRSPDDWVSHEVWSADGGAVMYHGGYAEGPTFIGRIEPASGHTTEIALPDDWQAYGHFITGGDDRLVTDGYYRAPEDPDDRFGRWIALVDADWSAAQLHWTPLVRHGSSWSSQDAHPHPVFDHAGRNAYFTSDIYGSRAVYKVSIPT